MDTHKVDGYIIHTWGDPEKAKYIAKKYKRFSCDICGCYFEADSDHYKEYAQDDEASYSTLCPCCKQKVYSYDY